MAEWSLVMFGRVRVSCPKCGDVKVRSDDVVIAARPDAMQNTYQFRCSSCVCWTIRAAGAGVLAMLLRSGARVAPSQQTSRFAERSAARGPISDAVLIEFLETLDQTP